MNNEKTYTLAELTPLLCPNYDEEEAYRTSRRIQSQVNVGLIRPIKNKHVGRGVHREYTRFELYKARVLLELDPFQVPNTVLRLVADLFDDANPDRKSPLTRQSAGKKKQKKQLSSLLSKAITNEQSVYLIINQDETGVLQANFGTSIASNKSWRSAIVLNLTEIIRTVK